MTEHHSALGHGGWRRGDLERRGRARVLDYLVSNTDHEHQGGHVEQRGVYNCQERHASATFGESVGDRIREARMGAGADATASNRREIRRSQ